MIGNLYNMARCLIPSDDLEIIRFLGNTTNDVGQEIPSYSEPTKIDGTFQAVDSKLYEQLGLDLNNHYRVLYTNEDLTEIDKGTSSDRILFNGETYQVLDKNDWFNYNGWIGVLCVRL